MKDGLQTSRVSGADSWLISTLRVSHHMHHGEQTAGQHEGHGDVREADVSLDTEPLEGSWFEVSSQFICSGRS